MDRSKFMKEMENMLSHLSKIDKARHKEVVDYICDIGYIAMITDKKNNLTFGWYKNIAKVFDKMSINRTTIKNGIKLKVFLSSDEPCVNYLRSEINRVLECNIDSKAPSVVVLCYYILHSMGVESCRDRIKAFDDNKEVMRDWLDNFIIGWLITKPNGYFISDILKQDYVGMDFNAFMNMSAVQLDNHFKSNYDILESMKLDYKLALLAEMCLYAPHLIKTAEQYL